jgi:hypothetical protein
MAFIDEVHMRASVRGARQAGGLALMAALLALSAPARATHLDAAACTSLEVERNGLAAAGTRKDMQNGAEWAKTNLSKERLDRIGRLIEVEEQIAFRCRPTRAVAAASETGPEPRAATAKPAATGTAAAAAPADEAAPQKRKRTRHAKAEAPAATAKPSPSKAAASDDAPAKPRKAKHARKAAPEAEPAPEAPVGTLQAPAAPQ